MPEPIRIDGLKQFTRNLKRLDSDLPKMLRVGMNDSLNVVINYAKPRIPSRTGRAAGSLKGKSTQTSARLQAGGRRAPYFPWLDFGGKTGRNRSVDRPFYKEGRYLWKGYIVKRDELNVRLLETMVNVTRAAGLEVD